MQGVTHTHLFAHTRISQAHTHRQTCSTSIHTFMYMYTFIYMHTQTWKHAWIQSVTLCHNHMYTMIHMCTHIYNIYIYTHAQIHTCKIWADSHLHILSQYRSINIHTHILAQLSSWQHYHSTKNKLQHRALLIETTPSPALCCTWAQPSQCSLFIWDPAGNFQGFPMTPSSNSLLADGISCCPCVSVPVFHYLWIY